MVSLEIPVQFKLMTKAFYSSVVIIALFFLPAAQVQGAYVFDTNFTKNANIQTNLIAQFPTGLWVTTNAFATPFEILTNGTGQNFYNAYTPLTNNVSIPAVSRVYTLMNAYNPEGAPLATVEFKGDLGADQTFTLYGGVDIRDFYQGTFVNSINDTTTENAFEVFDVQGAGGTGNVNNGDTGNYVVDEQLYTLAPVFLTQHLSSIIISGMGYGTPIVLGITAQVAAPVIAGVTQSANTLTLQVSGGETNLSYITLTSTNVTMPVAQWLPMATNSPAANGNFSITLTNVINPVTPKQFFTVEMQ
jgi:hypothetical protein